MPVVTIRFIEGRSQEKKDEIARRVNEALSDVLQIPKNDTWIVFEVGDATAAELRRKGLLAGGA
jgi:4-oxalocrotonate tautomerase